MFSLKVVIARLLGTTTPPMDNPVPPTQTAGLANKELTQPAGNKRSAQTTKVAPQKPKRKPKAAQSTTQASSRKQEPKSVRKASGATGKQPTLVSKTPQHAKPKAKRKP